MSDEKPPQGFISSPSLEDLQPTEAEKAKFTQLFAWMEASKHSNFQTGPSPDAAHAELQSLRTTLDTVTQQRDNLLCRIHRDGGHYLQAHGAEKACEDADAIVVKLFQKIEDLQSERDTLRAAAPTRQATNDSYFQFLDRLADSWQRGRRRSQ